MCPPTQRRNEALTKNRLLVKGTVMSQFLYWTHDWDVNLNAVLVWLWAESDSISKARPCLGDQTTTNPETLL